MQGILNLDKPAGISSARAVAAVKRLIPSRPRVGHAGTLDPFATGVLLILIGKATRWCESLMDQPKVYRATFKLGATTPTDGPDSAEQPWPGHHNVGRAPPTIDPSNAVGDAHPTNLGPAAEVDLPSRPTTSLTPPSREQLLDALPQFIGTHPQRPPPFSAIRVAGRRAYDLARRGELVVLPSRPVTVYAIDLESYEWPLLDLRIECGRGFYVRSLARDLGEVLGVGGYVTALRRLAVGPFNADAAASLDSLQASGLAPSLLHQWPAAL
jgi:tRNA pseudouridine55 synthase